MNDLVIEEWNGDVLKRRKYASFLTKYLKDKKESCVININAPWGCGKTFFLKNWYEDIRQNHPAVYFNAWENDYQNDPLISIISCIKKKLVNLLPENIQINNSRKNFLSKSGNMLKKATPLLAKLAVNKLLGPGGAEALREISEETEDSLSELSSKVFEEILDSHEAVSNAIEDFKKSLEVLIKEIKDAGNENNRLESQLFIFIDELDRCRPTYSVELLEKLKHIFNINNIVFVVATDTLQLSHSVKAVYGEGFNGELYLRRFFDQIYTLPEPNCIEFTNLLFKNFTNQARFFDYSIACDPAGAGRSSSLNKHTLSCKKVNHAQEILIFSLFAKYFMLDLRSKKQCFDRFIAIEKSVNSNEEIHFAYLMFLIMLEAKNPSLFQKYFDCSNAIERKAVFDKLPSCSENLVVLNSESQNITPRNIIEKYSNTLFLPKNEIRRVFNDNHTNSFDVDLMVHIYNNLEYLGRYKEMVEMAGAIG